MKQLLLYRHAKSSWDDDSLADRDRPLADRGRHDAALMAGEIAEYPIHRILCSPARRTLETLAALLPLLRGAFTIAVTDQLYQAAGGDYRRLIAGEGGDADCLLVIGHNPAMQATAVGLIGEGDESDRAVIAGKYPTAALAVIAFDVDTWTKIRPQSGRLTAFRRPRDLDQGD